MPVSVNVSNGEEASRSGSAAKALILVAIVTAGILASRFPPLSEYLSPERLQAFFASIAKFWWAPLAYIGIYVSGTLVAAPGLLLTILGGLTFGTVNGAIYVFIGANLGANLTFGLARKLGRDYVARKVKGRIDTLDRLIRNQGLLRVLQLRLIPMVPFNMLNYAFGLSGVRYVHYLLGTLFGMIPGILVYVYASAALAQLYFSGSGVQNESAAAAAREAALTNAGISMGLLIVVSLAPYFYRKISKHSTGVEEG